MSLRPFIAAPTLPSFLTRVVAIIRPVGPGFVLRLTD